MDVESLIREEFLVLDPLPSGAEGDWHDVLGRVERPTQRRRWAFAVSAVTAVAAVVIAVLALLPAGGGGPTTAAAAALDRLAGLVAAQSLTPQPGQYLYIQSKADYGAIEGDCEIRSVQHNQIWIAPNGSGLDRETFGPGRFTSPADRSTCLQMARKEGRMQELRQQLAPKTGNGWYAPRCLSLKPMNDLDWSSLSSDPQVLLQQILPPNPGRPWTPYDKFSMIEEFLHDTDAPPAVRATLYRAAALIPGVQLLGTVHDHDGRPGLGVALTSHLGTYELIFDQHTGELSGEQQTGAVAGWTVYLSNKVVNGLPSKPPAPLEPACTKQGEGVSHPVPGGSITNGAPLDSP